MGYFIINKTETGFVFLLKADDGKTIGNSEVYTTLSKCQNGIESVRKNCNSHIEDQTVGGFEQQKSPKYEVYNDKGGRFRFRLKASNGQNIFASMGYETWGECMGYIRCLGEVAPDAQAIMPGEEVPAPKETAEPEEERAEPVPDAVVEAEPEPVEDAEPEAEPIAVADTAPKAAEPDEKISKAEPGDESCGRDEHKPEKKKKKRGWKFWKWWS